jgi:predicted HAD superfamily phosphohydrolase YqeG
VRSDYERHTELDDVLVRAGKLSVRTMIVDVEPFVSWWRGEQESLDWGVAMLVGKVSMLPALRVLVFATNSARRPSAIPAGQGFEVRYVASAGKPLRTAPYRGLPRPGAIVGDQVATDGLLARRLGFTFLHYQPQLADVPLGPRLLQGFGHLALPLVFSRSAENRPTGHGHR